MTQPKDFKYKIGKKKYKAKKCDNCGVNLPLGKKGFCFDCEDKLI